MAERSDDDSVGQKVGLMAVTMVMIRVVEMVQRMVDLLAVLMVEQSVVRMVLWMVV